jgi:hypothetical protein
MMTLMREPCEIDFCGEKVKLALDLRRRSGKKVQDQKNELSTRIDEPIQKESDFRVRLQDTPLSISPRPPTRPHPSLPVHAGHRSDIQHRVGAS